MAIAMKPLSSYNGSDDSLGHLSDSITAPMKILYALSSLLLLNMLLSIIGNVFVLVAFSREKPLGEPLRVILGNLAVSNIIIAVIGEPMVCISGFNGRWVFGDMGRKFEAYVVTACGLVAMSLLGFISIERLLRILPTSKLRPINATKAARVCTIIWIYNFIYAGLPFFGVATWTPEGIGISNSISWDTGSSTDLAYVTIMMMTGYFLPLLTVVFCYYRILSFVRRAVDLINNAPVPMSHAPKTMTTKISLTDQTTSKETPSKSEARSSDMGQDSTIGLAPQGHSEEPYDVVQTRKIKAAERKMIHIIAVMISTFFISWTPYAILNLLVTFNKAGKFTHGIYATAPALFAKTSTFWSPVVYCFMDGEIRSAMLRVWRDVKRWIRITYFGGGRRSKLRG